MAPAAPEPKSLASQLKSERDQLRRHLLALRESSARSPVAKRLRSRKAQVNPDSQALQSRMNLRETRYLSTEDMQAIVDDEFGDPETPEDDVPASTRTIEGQQDALGGPLCDICPAALMRDVLDKMPAMVWAKRIPDGLMLLANEAAAEMGGTTREKMQNTLPEKWWPKSFTDRWLIDDNEVASTGRPKPGYLERIVHPKSNQVRWLRTHKTPVMDGQGVVFAVLVFSYDVTDILPPSMRVQD